MSGYPRSKKKLLDHSIVLIMAGLMEREIPSHTPALPAFWPPPTPQVAALMVKELVGPDCHDIIICPQLRGEEEEAALQLQLQPGSEPNLFSIEAALLVMEAAGGGYGQGVEVRGVWVGYGGRGMGWGTVAGI